MLDECLHEILKSFENVTNFMNNYILVWKRERESEREREKKREKKVRNKKRRDKLENENDLLLLYEKIHQFIETISQIDQQERNFKQRITEGIRCFPLSSNRFVDIVLE